MNDVQVCPDKTEKIIHINRHLFSSPEMTGKNQRIDMQEAVLFVDDDKAVLGHIENLFQNKGLKILTAGSPREALKFFAGQEIAVLVSDNVMPEMSGLELLARIGKISPDTVKIMMTAYADLPTTLAAINKGEVFRFVTKPWPKGEMIKAVKDGIRRFRLLQSMKKEDEFVLHSLAQTIELKDPRTRGHCDRVAAYALQIAGGLGLPEEIKKDIKYGSWLHDCGKIGVPETILNANRSLTGEEFELVKMHPVWGADVVRKANLSAIVQNIVLYHHERCDGSGYPSGLKGNNIPLEARIVAVADVYDALLSERPYRKGCSQEETIGIIREMTGNGLDSAIVGILLSLLEKTGDLKTF
ncbi:MAG: response regulator [Geobacteraceae bacterium]|nr:MAG: response regulator [Geobacteraceae bacterium]